MERKWHKILHIHLMWWSQHQKLDFEALLTWQCSVWLCGNNRRSVCKKHTNFKSLRISWNLPCWLVLCEKMSACLISADYWATSKIATKSVHSTLFLQRWIVITRQIAIKRANQLPNHTGRLPKGIIIGTWQVLNLFQQVRIQGWYS